MNRKTNRAKRVDRACRNRGPCAWCRGNRTYSSRKRLQKDER